MARDVPLVLTALCFAWCLTAALCIVPPFTDVARRKPATIELREFCHEPDHNLTQLIRNTSFTAYARVPIPQLKANNTQLWDRLYERKLIVSEKVLAEGRGNLGDTERLERFMHKLMAGQPVTIAVVGGSVSAGVGVLQGNNSYVQRLYHWINTTFPHKDHRLLNFALPATTSAYYAPCVTSGLLPNNTDLVILEFTFNDSEMALFHHQLDDRTRRGLERILRKLLRMDSQPAVLYYHYWPPLWPLYAGAYYLGGEHFSEAIMGYYGVPSLSLRLAIHHELQLQPDLLHQVWWPEEVWKDQLHPTCIGHRFMVDQIIGTLQNTGAGVLLRHDRLPGLQKEPIFEGVQDSSTEYCVQGDAFVELVVHNQGFVWGNAGEDPENRPQMGFISDHVGATMNVVVPIDATKVDLQFPSKGLVVAFELLMFYQIMGILNFKCMGGCVCMETEYSLMHPPGTLQSHKYWKSLPMMLVPELGNCVVTITNSIKTRSGLHRGVVSGIMVSSELGFIDTHKWCPECLPLVDPLNPGLG